MNERIEELIAQCSFTVTEYSMGIDSSYEDFDKELFAELIVRECAKFAEQYIAERCDRDYCVGVAVQRHFGVEE